MPISLEVNSDVSNFERIALQAMEDALIPVIKSGFPERQYNGVKSGYLVTDHNFMTNLMKITWHES